MSTTTAQTKRPSKRRVFDYSLSYWAKAVEVPAATSVDQLEEVAAPQPVEQVVSETPVCHKCNESYSSFVQQRAHFNTDWHKYNLQRRLHQRDPISEAEFDDLSDLGSVGSLSGSEPENSDGEGDVVGGAKLTLRLAEKLEFQRPGEEDGYIVLYRAALPDQESLASLANRGSWAVMMAGGGHFCAAIWDVKGAMVRHKTFHRYTSRRKQGGSQAAADEARGNASRIKSAGATLRRYGEQALQKEVHALLNDWRADLAKIQCVFVRASQRDKRDLLSGWDGSPLKDALNRDSLRNIPFPTRRATLKEAQRVYEELSTVRESTISLAQLVPQLQESQQKKKGPSKAAEPQKRAASKKPEVKGTDHLKKRDAKEKIVKEPQQAPQEAEEPSPEVDEVLVDLMKLIIAGEEGELLNALRENMSHREALFQPHYFKDDKRFEKLESGLGVVGVAALCGNKDLVEKLLNEGVSPAVGISPYVATKSKSIRMLFRTYWGQHPEKYDYKAAGIPGPLTEADLEEMASREKAKRKKDRERKKEKEREKAEAAKSPEERAREIRAAAAEARMLGNRCAACKKSLEGLVPFERLAYKYCSTTCVSRHREALNNMPRR